MATFVSPGIYTVEKDVSEYITDLSSTIVGIVGTSDKGPTNTPVLVTGAKEFVDIFGAINPKHYLGYAAMAYLEKGATLWVNRVASTDAKKAVAAFPVPSSYTNYAGNWELDSVSGTDVILKLTNDPSATGANKIIKLDSDTKLPGFDWTDISNDTYINGKLGADYTTFLASDYAKHIVGGSFTVTLGAGKGTVTTITGVAGDSTTPKIKINSSAFVAANSPLTAYAVSTLTSDGTKPANDTVLIEIARNTTDTASFNLVADDTVVFDLANLQSSVQATKLTALEAIMIDANSVGIPLTASDVAGNNEKILAVLNALLYVVNLASAPSETTLAAFYAAYRASLGSGVYGVGVISSGASKGYKATSTVLDANGDIVSIRLDSLVAGPLGIYSYGTVNGLVATNQTIAGSFTTSLNRPVWEMTESGSYWVPTIVKISSIGESATSNLAVTFGLDKDELTSEQVQKYILKVYERNVAASIDPTSTKMSDFTLIEQFDGSLEAVQSKVASFSRKISMKIDYTTTDNVNYTTGAVVYGAESDGLAPDFVLNESETGVGVSLGTSFVLGVSQYDKVLDAFLTGGTVGSPISKSDIIGNAATSTGIYAFANPEVLDVNVLIAPGWSSDPSVARVLAQVSENRGDCMAIIDCPFGLSPQDMISYRKNILNMNTSYAALYYPWVKITDSVNKKDVFIPPSGLVAAQYAYNDQVSDVFYAPAGRTRGTLNTALATEKLLSQGDRDLLYQNQINPIHTEAGYGIYIKGQRTLQTATTALDRVNVRRLLLKLRKVVATGSKIFEFEPNDTTTAYRLKQLAETVLEDHLKRGALQSYTVDVGPTVNTTLVRENNELRMDIRIVPTKTAEIIIETFYIQPQGGGVRLA